MQETDFGAWLQFLTHGWLIFKRTASSYCYLHCLIVLYIILFNKFCFSDLGEELGNKII